MEIIQLLYFLLFSLPLSLFCLSLSLSLSCFCFVCYCLVDNEWEVGWLVDEDTLDYHVFCVASIHSNMGLFFDTILLFLD